MTIRAKPLPAVTSIVAPDLRRFLDRLRETFDDPDGLVTKTELLDTGAFKNNTAGFLKYVEPGEETSYTSPPAPLNLVAAGSMTAIVLTWSGVNYNTGYAYTEVWRASADNLGASVLIGTATAGMYADAVGSDAAHYYWVRMVNVLNDKGPFNATAGVAGSTSPDLAYVFSQLTAAYGVSSDAPFFQLTSNTTINGVVIPAGTYIKEAKIFNGSITNAKIGALAVDAAKIADATIINAKIADATIETAKIKDANITTAKIGTAAITTAKIADGNITNAKIGNTIQSAAYSAGSAGWKIDKTGAMEMNNATFRGTLDVGGSSGSRVKITSDKIEVYNGSTLRVKIGNLA
tara:strand:- start:2026 stop:3069 length:1044 start_codon:yes stop_codon:yes gene_type:complete